MTTTLEPAPAAPPTPGRRAVPWLRRHRDRLLLGGALPFVLLGLARSTAFAEGDTYWQVTTGAEILARGTTALVEDDSWTAAGTPWHPNSWGFDVLAHLAHQLGGWAGLGWFTVLVVSAVGVAVAVVGRRLGASAPALTLLGLVVAVPVIPWLSARPHTVSFALLVLVVGSAGRVLTTPGRRGPVLGCVGLAALVAVWVNLHVAALSGIAAVGGGAAAVVLAGPAHDLLRRRADLRTAVRELRRPVAVVGAVALGCLASPVGAGILAAAEHTAGASVELIDEWAPLWRAEPILVATWVTGALGLGVLAAAWWRTARVGRTPAWLPFWTGAVAALVLGGLTVARFSPMAVVVALPAVAAVLTTVRVSGLPWLARRAALAVPVAIGAAVLGLALTSTSSFGRPGPLFPAAATIAAIPDGCRVLNEYDEGGLLTLLRGDDGVLVSVDGRNDVYGVDTLLETERLKRGEGGALDTLAADGVGCLLLEPDRPLVARAVAAGWQLTARDDARVLLVAP